MIRPLALTDSYFVNGLGHSEESAIARRDLSDYLYLVADCLTVVFHEAKSLGLSDIDLIETANRYLDEARTSLESLIDVADVDGLPQQIGAPPELLTVAAALNHLARLLEEAEFPEVLS